MGKNQEKFIMIEQCELFNKHRHLVYRVYKDKFSDQNESLKDDVISMGLLALWKACKNFDPDRNTKFVTYAYTSIKNAMSTFLYKQTKKTIGVISIDAPVGGNEQYTYLDIIACPQDFTARFDLQDAIDKVLESFDSDTCKIVHYTIKGYTQNEIAKILNSSQVQVSRSLNKFRKKLTEEM